MAKDTCCGCCHITTGAAIGGVLQAVIVVALLSTSAILLQKSQTMKSDYDTYLNAHDSQNAQSTSPTISGWTTTPVWLSANWTWAWKESGLISFVEIHLTHHIAFYSLWLVFLAMYAMAFKAYRPALVLPNLIMQVISVALLMILGGVIIAELVFLSVRYQNFKGSQSDKDDLDAQYAGFGVLLGCLVIGWVAELVFIWIGIEFYHFVRDTQHTVYPSVQASVIAANAPNPQRNPQDAPQMFAASIEATPKFQGDTMA